jgi:hypothetical protein
MTQKVQRTVAASAGLVLVLAALALPWMGLGRYPGDPLFALFSIALFVCAGSLYFWAVRPDLLKVYVTVVVIVALLGAFLIHWMFQGYG